MARQKGFRVKLELFIPYNGLDSMMAAATAAKRLETKEGLSGIKELQGVEVEHYEVKETSRGAEAA